MIGSDPDTMPLDIALLLQLLRAARVGPPAAPSVARSSCSVGLASSSRAPASAPRRTQSARTRRPTDPWQRVIPEGRCARRDPARRLRRMGRSTLTVPPNQPFGWSMNRYLKSPMEHRAERGLSRRSPCASRPLAGDQVRLIVAVEMHLVRATTHLLALLQLLDDVRVAGRGHERRGLGTARLGAAHRRRRRSWRQRTEWPVLVHLVSDDHESSGRWAMRPWSYGLSRSPGVAHRCRGQAACRHYHSACANSREEARVRGWRATFYVTAIAHSILGGSAWEPTVWRAVICWTGAAYG